MGKTEYDSRYGVLISNTVSYLGIELSLSRNKKSDIFKFIVLENEFWSYVSSFPYRYKISSLGRVKRVTRVTEIAGRKTLLKEKFLSRHVSRDGYLTTSFADGKNTLTFSIHRLVGFNYVVNPNVFDLNEINHINGNKKDCRMMNLEWSDRSKNIQHGYNMGLFPLRIGESNPSHKLTENQVIQIKKDKKEKPHLNLRYFAEKYNVDQSTISLIHRGINWKHIKV